MRFVESVTINGKRWRVTLKPLAHRGINGQCIYRRHEIQIDSGLPRAERIETLIHEIMHACLCERWPRKTEERMIARLAPRLLESLRDIKWVRR